MFPKRIKLNLERILRSFDDPDLKLDTQDTFTEVWLATNILKSTPTFCKKGCQSKPLNLDPSRSWEVIARTFKRSNEFNLSIRRIVH